MESSASHLIVTGSTGVQTSLLKSVTSDFIGGTRMWWFFGAGEIQVEFYRVTNYRSQ